jgi:hypothetical protein
VSSSVRQRKVVDFFFSTEALLFWVDAENYRKSDNILYDTKTEAKAIFDKYLTLESDHLINIDGKVANNVRVNAFKSRHFAANYGENLNARSQHIYRSPRIYIRSS